jgi:hypothetical protein
MDKIIASVKIHLEWRQDNIPFPYLDDGSLALLHSGIMYIHGRCKDHSPILCLNFIMLSDLFKKKMMDEHKFCRIHNFFATYMQKNMLIPGQVERWCVILNVNNFSLKELPLMMFKACKVELEENFIDNGGKQIVVNLTWF